MISQWYVLAMMFKVLLAFVVVFIVIPWKVVRFDSEADKFLDKVFICLIHSTLIIILVAHILAFSKLYEYFSLVFVLFLVFIFSQYWSVKTWPALAEALGVRAIVHILDLSEGRLGLKEQLRQKWTGWCALRKARLSSFFRSYCRDPFAFYLPLAVILAAAYLRFEHSIFNGTFTLSDTYAHLAWSKRMGMNEIYYYGVYSYGLHSIISALSKLFFLDAYWICRFLGPLAGAFLVLSVYYFALRTTENKAASLVAVVIYGLVNHADFPLAFIRQTSLLTQEYATFFVLPGLYYLWLYFKYRKNKYLLLYAEALAVTFFVHPFGAFYLALWSGIMFILAWVPLKINLRLILAYGAANIIAIVVPLIALGIGLLMGIELFRSSFNFIKDSISLGQNTLTPSQFVTIIFMGGWIQDVVVFLAIILGLISFHSYRWGQKPTAILSLTLSLTTLVTFLLYRSNDLHIPSVVDFYRTGTFLALLIPVIFAGALNVLAEIMSQASFQALRRYSGITMKVTVLVLCVFVLYSYPYQAEQGDELEYDAAVQNYLVIKRDFPALDWTIVGPTEQLEQVIGVGWHSDILRLVQRYTPEEVGKPAFKWPIPTSHIFFYTEKIPFHWGRSVALSDAEKELEPEGNDPFAQYYHTGDQRAILEAKAIRLMEAYRASHDMSIFYEDEEMRIYYVYQELDPNYPINLPDTELAQRAVLRQ